MAKGKVYDVSRQNGKIEFTDTNKKNSENVVVLNKTFNKQIPMFYIDSGVAITFGFISHLERQGVPERKIKQAIISGNIHNLDYKTVDVLYDLYKQNQNGEIAFCVPPAVYKETMIDNLVHDDLNKSLTRKFVTENCFLAFPNEDALSFAKKSVALEQKLREVYSDDKIFGLNTEMKRRKIDGNEKRVWIDQNFKDRMILSQIAIIAKQGKQNVTFISCSGNVYDTNNKVKNLYGEEKRLDAKENLEGVSVEAVDPENVVFIQINSNDFGCKVFIEDSNTTERRGKKQVAERLESVLDEFFEGKGSLQVKTPLEL